MKKKLLVMLFFIGFITLSIGCRNCTPADNINIAALRNCPNFKGSAFRLQALQEAATTLGAQGGLAWRSAQINCVLKRQADLLERVYNFRALLLQDDIIPPVLEEGRNELTVDDCSTIRASDRIYRIITPPCFVTAPPNWRDYLWMAYCRPDTCDATLLPKTTEEAAAWNCFIRIGWQHGIEQANQIFAANLARLKRDYNGMVLYRALLAQNMVTAPFVAKTELGVTGDANQMRINDRVLRIATVPQLNTNPDTWCPAIAHPGCEPGCQTPPVCNKVIVRKKKVIPKKPKCDLEYYLNMLPKK